ncbi:MAG: replication-associated recombination protein A [Acidimicrobiales bacterium]
MPRRPERAGDKSVRSQASLFEAAADRQLQSSAPLASRMRPATLDEVVGQRHLFAPGAPLRALIEADCLASAVFYGPPGTGKTSVARLVARSTKRRFRALSAVDSGVKDLRAELDDARDELGAHGIGTILFLDEIHRFNKAQQDALLHGVEDGVIGLIGATTENPFFALNAALLSRSTLWRFESLNEVEISEIARRAAHMARVVVSDEAVLHVVDLACGDARVAITVVELAAALAAGALERVAEASRVVLEARHIDQARSMRAFRHGTDEHYDLISALIKSVRGSDPDAGLYWLARLLEVGEDARFVARRLVVLASEDVGMADPMAVVVASAAASAVELVGLPEASLNLAQAVVHLSLAPKSNSVATAIWKAQDDVRNGSLAPVPPRLRGAGYRGATAVGSGVGYEYPHDEPSGYVAQQYLPDELAGRRYYAPRSHGAEASLAKRWRERRGELEPVDPREETSP